MSVEASGFRVSRTTFTSGTLASHYHERACLTVVIEGSFTEYFARRSLECRRGGFLLKPAGERHHDQMAGSMQLIVEPDERAIANMGESASMFDRIASERSLVATAMAGRITRELAGWDPFTTLAVEGLTFELLVSALRAGPGGTPSRAPRWLAQVRDRIHDEPRPVPIADLAALARVNPAYLARAFRRWYGQSIGQYARRVRLEWVALQLTETREPLSAIAVGAGFADQSHLTRAFRARWGVTPRQYRLGARGPATLG